MINRFNIFLYLVCVQFSATRLIAQQPVSPLQSSFETYRKMKEDTKYNLNWVSLGPTVNSARADVVQVDHTKPGTMYVGFGSGGVWKTINNGITWSCVFENQASLGIGDMELAPSNSSVIYVGTGENIKKPRNFTLPGTGMYRSEDAGKTWKHIGLEDSWSIAEIAIHPKNPDIVFVAVLGHLWSKNKNRGLYRTINGGKTWEQVLYKNEMTGANDIVISPSNPKIMYCSLWEMYPGISGVNSGVYKSNDGGKTWNACVNGLPTGPKIGRIGITVSYTNPSKAYALIDNLNNERNDAAELYQTTDGGVTWKKTHAGPFKIFGGIGWYFTDVYVNPINDNEVFSLGIRLAHSTDGGKTFSYIGGKVNRVNPGAAKGLHLDQCELWINPKNPDHIALGNDGGFFVSYDKGLSWLHYNNIPVGEFYDLTIDQSTNTVYGGTQDNATVYGPSKEININFPDTWKYIWIDPWDGGDGCVTQVDPDDNNIVYYSSQHGGIVRYNKSKDSVNRIMPKLPVEIKDTLVFNYVTPYFISPHQSSTLYHGGNYIFKSTNRGDSWKVISPNIASSSVKEKKSFAAGALVESMIEKGLLYTGTDKGAFWVSKNDGQNWEENSTGLANNYIRSICPSRFVKERVYLAMTGINYDDLHSYLYVSEDYGKNWKSINKGLPDEPANVILEDPTNENILYAGGLRGVYISIDMGKTWSCLGQQMPDVAIADLEIQSQTMELVVATHGRGIYKIDLLPIQKMVTQNLSASQNHLFEIPDTRRPRFSAWGGDPDYSTAQKIPFAFWLKQKGKVRLSVIDTTGKEIWANDFPGNEGFNQYRWDLIISREKSDLPYFVQYEKLIRAGAYNLLVTQGEMKMEKKFIVANQ